MALAVSPRRAPIHAMPCGCALSALGSRARLGTAAILLVACSNGSSGSSSDASSPPPAATCAALAHTPASSVLCQWTDYPGDPVLAPPGQPIIGDPTVLAPEESPDGRWHLFAWEYAGIVHYASPDGIAWTLLDMPFKIGTARPNLFKEGSVYHLLFDKFSQIVMPQASTIQISESTDLMNWSDPVTILEPSLPWEMETQNTVGNAFVLARDGQYWLYYSAAGVLLPDTGYTEPKYIGLARATNLHGPYTKQPQPLLTPASNVAWRNMGAGAMKLLGDQYAGRWVAMENGIYADDAGASHSALQVLESTDGVAWSEACPAPPLAPTGTGWKKAFVYASDSVRRGGDLRVYYNARDGWANGVERIGFSSVTLPCP